MWFIASYQSQAMSATFQARYAQCSIRGCISNKLQIVRINYIPQLLPATILLLIAATAHHVWSSALIISTIWATLGVIRRPNTISASWPSSWSTSTRHTTSGVRRGPTTWRWIWPAGVSTTLTTTIRVVAPTGITTTLWVPTWSSRRSPWLSVVVTRASSHLGWWGIMNRLAGTRPDLRVHLPRLLDWRQTGMRLWMLQFLPLCCFFLLPLLLPLLLCLELVRWLIFWQAVGLNKK